MPKYKNSIAQIIKSGITMLWVLLCVNCITPVDIPVENVGGRLVVSGQISNIPDQNIIYLQLTADTERLPYPLSGAAVLLMDDTGQIGNYEEDPSTPGAYRLQDVTGIPGNTYYIKVLTQGKSYESLPEKMPTNPGELSTGFEFEQQEYTDAEGIVVTDRFINIYSNSTVPQQEEDPYLRWSIEEAFLLSPTDFPDPFGYVPPPCFIVQNADPQRVTLLDGTKFQSASIENLLIGSRLVDWTFLERHYFTTYQTSMTREAYDYWNKVRILVNQVGSIFDTPPAKVKGNVFNINNPGEVVSGYVEVVNQTYDRFYVLRQHLPFNLVVIECTYDGRNLDEYPGRCLDCLSARNSSHQRPSWF